MYVFETRKVRDPKGMRKGREGVMCICSSYFHQAARLTVRKERRGKGKRDIGVYVFEARKVRDP